MPTPRTGNPAATQSPSPAPGPRVLPVSSIPGGGEVRTIESITQQIQVKDDFIAHVQTAVGLDVPVLNSGATGFTAVTASGLGGTIAPSGGVHIADGTRFVVQIQLGGVVGVATFKTSMDGGNTYGALQTTAASMTDATSGITLAFTGTFTALGTATFRSAFTPLAQWNNSVGNARYLVDHNAMPGGRVLVFQEQWLLQQAQTSTPANPLSNYPLWMTTISGTGATFGGAGSFPTDQRYAGRYADAQPFNTASGAKSFIATTNKLVDPSKNVPTWTLCFDGGMDIVGNNAMTVYMGMSTGQDPSAVTSGFIWFKKAATDTNWQAQCGTGAPGAGTTTTFDTGVAAIASGSGFQRFRIEVHGASSAYGALTVVFFVDNSAPVVITTNIPANSLSPLYLAFGGINTSTSGAHDVAVGTIWLTQNLYASAVL